MSHSFYMNCPAILIFSILILLFRLEEIGGAASKEYSLEKAMEKMKEEWSDVYFEFTPYRDTVCNNQPINQSVSTHPSRSICANLSE